MPLTDVTRASFRNEPAVRDQVCACECGNYINKGQMIWARNFIKRDGSFGGTTRIIDLDEHYERWFEKVSRTYARAAAKRNPKFKKYLG
jgi:hypothetical protein